MREAPIEIVQMEHWGCPWSRNPDGTHRGPPVRWHDHVAHVFAADKTGFHMLHTVFQTSLKYPQIHRHDEAFVTKLLIEDTRCVGVVAVDMRSGPLRRAHREVDHPRDRRPGPHLRVHHQRQRLHR